MKSLLVCLVGIGFLSMNAKGRILSMEPIRENLPFFDNRLVYPDSDLGGGSLMAVTSALPLPCPDPVNLLVTRSVYPAEDRSIDAVVWFDPERFSPKTHRLSFRIASEGGEATPVQSDALEGGRHFVSLAIPESLQGKKGALEVSLVDASGRSVGTARSPVEVLAVRAQPQTGEVSLRFDRRARAVPGTPMRVGVPMPRGFYDPAKQHLRVVDAKGNEVPADFEVTGKWAKHGTVKWGLLTFLAAGANDEYRLQIASGAQPPKAGLLPVGKKLSSAELAAFSRKVASGSKRPTGAALVNERFLRGGFVEHARGANYSGWGHKILLTPGNRFEVPPDAEWIVESGRENVIGLRCESWFVKPETGEKFCQFRARIRIYPGSPFLDFEYTWIFTGDGNRDRIRNMGWQFFEADFKPEGFLLGDGNKVSVAQGAFLHHIDSTAYRILDSTGKQTQNGKRADGFALGKVNGVTVAFGVRDFWENFPSEIGLSNDGFTFHLWPKHGAPRTHPVKAEDAYKLWFAHEGEVLSFSLPMELTEGPLYVAASGVEPAFSHGLPETVNAQGIAKTTEFRFCVADSLSTEALHAGFQSWNDRSADPHADPAWVAKTEVFPGLHPLDHERFRDFEEDYARVAHWPAKIAEEFQVYGKWIYGDIPMVADVEKQSVGLYRAYEKAHWGWSYSWVPYARSGDATYRKLADTATRMMTDTAYCHYVSDELRAEFAALPPRAIWAFYQPFRAKGWNNEGLLPWAGGYWGPTSRMYCDRVDTLFDQWHLTGYAPGMDVARDWMGETKIESPELFGRGPIVSAENRTRWTDNLLRQYLLAYEESFDPWFIMGAHAIAKMHLAMEKSAGWQGHFWQGGITDFARYTRNPAYREFHLRFARKWLRAFGTVGWDDLAPLIEPAIQAWNETKEPWFLQRALAYAEHLKSMIRTEKKPDVYEGWIATGGTNEAGLYHGWYLRWAPSLFSALASAPERLRPVPNGFSLRGTPPKPGETVFPEIRLRLSDPVVESEVVLAISGMPAGSNAVVRIESPGQPPQETALKAGINRVPLPDPRPGRDYTVSLVATAETGKSPFSVRMPIAPESIREVVRLAPGGVLAPSERYNEFWFQAPRSGEEAAVRVQMKPAAKYPVRRASLWSEERRLLNDIQILNRDIPPAGLEQTLAIPPSVKPGEMVGVTVPGVSSRTALPEGIRPWWSVSAEKWFDPEATSPHSR